MEQPQRLIGPTSGTHCDPSDALCSGFQTDYRRKRDKCNQGENDAGKTVIMVKLENHCELFYGQCTPTSGGKAADYILFEKNAQQDNLEEVKKDTTSSISVRLRQRRLEAERKLERRRLATGLGNLFREGLSGECQAFEAWPGSVPAWARALSNPKPNDGVRTFFVQQGDEILHTAVGSDGQKSIAFLNKFDVTTAAVGVYEAHKRNSAADPGVEGAPYIVRAPDGVLHFISLSSDAANVMARYKYVRAKWDATTSSAQILSDENVGAKFI